MIPGPTVACGDGDGRQATEPGAGQRAGQDPCLLSACVGLAGAWRPSESQRFGGGLRRNRDLVLTKTLELVRRPEKCSRCPRLSLELLQGPWNPPPPHACRPLPVGSERGGGGAPRPRPGVWVLG